MVPLLLLRGACGLLFYIVSPFSRQIPPQLVARIDRPVLSRASDMALIGATRGVLTTRPGDAAPARTETYSLRVAAIPRDGGRTIREVRALAPQLQVRPQIARGAVGPAVADMDPASSLA